MNPEPDNSCGENSCCDKGRLALIAGILGAFLIVAVLVLLMRHYTEAPELNAKRVAERAKALADIRAAEHEALTTAAWLDPDKGRVRLPVSVSVEMVEHLWQNPAAARSNLLARVDKAYPPPPPPKPSAFE